MIQLNHEYSFKKKQSTSQHNQCIHPCPKKPQPGPRNRRPFVCMIILLSTPFRPMQMPALQLCRQKYFRILIKSNRNQIVFTIFRLIWNSKRTRPFVFQINRNMVNTIGFLFDLIRFLCVTTRTEKCTCYSCQIKRNQDCIYHFPFVFGLVQQDSPKRFPCVFPIQYCSSHYNSSEVKIRLSFFAQNVWYQIL